MKVLVFGATGTVGKYLVPQLVERGHEVTGTSTHAENVPLLERLGAHGVVVDGLDATAVNETVATTQPEAIISEMTSLKGTPDFKHFDRWFAKTNELRTTGTRNVLEAARKSGSVKRLIVQSYTGWTSDDSRDGLATEDEPFDGAPLPVQRSTLDAIKSQEQMALDAPLDAVVLRYANLYSADALDESVKMLEKRQFPIVGSGDGVWSWIHARDAASATVAALESGRSGIYNVADDEPAPVKVWLPYLAAVTGAPKPMRVPAWLAKFIIGDAGVRMMTRLRGVSNAKIKRELGWRPTYTTWRAGFREIAGDEPSKELIHVPIS